ncbi:hypothetical protein [Fusobacterium varium]|uniref:hypothetical protein n=1 Tax=Fusobacterium varium TaxID=856 RepID=UPI003EFF0C48
MKNDRKILENALLQIFTFDFGKIPVSLEKHYEKTKEENNELEKAVKKYLLSSSKDIETIAQARKNLCDEALDNAQSGISLLSHLIEEGIMGIEDIIIWRTKIEKRKEKYLKKESIKKWN